MSFKYGNLWDCMASYPTILKYWLIDEDKRGEITVPGELDEFAEKYKDYNITDITFFQHNGGIGLTIYLRGD